MWYISQPRISPVLGECVYFHILKKAPSHLEDQLFLPSMRSVQAFVSHSIETIL
jgi:hypothetical protein